MNQIAYLKDLDSNRMLCQIDSMGRELSSGQRLVRKASRCAANAVRPGSKCTHPRRIHLADPTKAMCSQTNLTEL